MSLTANRIRLLGYGFKDYNYSGKPVDVSDVYGPSGGGDGGENLLFSSFIGTASKFVVKKVVEPFINKYVGSPSGYRIVTSGIVNAIWGFGTGLYGGAVFGALSTGPFAGFGAIGGAVAGAITGFSSGLAYGLISQTVLEIYNVPEMIEDRFTFHHGL